MSMAHGLEVRVPFLDDLRVVEYAMSIPVQFKLEPRRNIEKWILRKSVEGLIPEEIVWRKKIKFADGAGLGDQLAAWAGGQISDEVFERCQKRFEAYAIRSKEELAYFLIFTRKFPAVKLRKLIGRSRSL